MIAKGTRVLVILAHPDDEAIGCGATISRLVRQGAFVRCAVPFQRLSNRQSWTESAAQFQRSVKELGAEAILPEDSIRETDMWHRPELLACKLQPLIEWSELVITHWDGDMHVAHQTVSQAVEIVVRPFRLQRTVLQCEIPTSSDQSFSRTFHPNLFVPVETCDVQRKCDAMANYVTELTPGRSPECLEARLRMRGSQSGGTFAEAFVVARMFL
jgi:LmbE family N-acetylglucosaminyl deacetylase